MDTIMPEPSAGPVKVEVNEISEKNEHPEPEPKINFECALCSLNELCDYKGTHPPFARQIHFSENCYVMRDPFSPQPGPHSNKSTSESYLTLGADCALCGQSICKSSECSLFYDKTFCLQCAMAQIKQFPLEMQTKIKKQVASAGTT